MYRGVLAFVLAALLASCAGDTTTKQEGEADSGCWTEVASPEPRNPGIEMGGIAALSEDDIWAVGQQATIGGGSRTLTLHWDGTGWSVAPSPNVAEGAGSRNQLYAVAALSANDVWAVGASADRTGKFRNLAMHWDGREWKVASPDSPGLLQNGLNAVDMLPGGEAWAVGTALSDEGKDPQMVLFHWAGSAWTQAPSPKHSSHNLLAVRAIARNDAWAAGTDVLHWDGREWQQVPSPVDHPGGYLDGLLAPKHDDVWVTGNDGNEAIAVHWNGSDWTGGVLPRLANGPFPHDIAALGTGEIWIAGEYSDDPTYSIPMLLKWDGRIWHAVRNPFPGRSIRLQGLAAVGDTLWAAGTQQDAEGTLPIFLRREPGACSRPSR
ncbi:MAG TPA: hypothetical protein VM409_06485 [Chloroflexia bacterium]|nr:hypothetical protein [Chloroflexia bacterium]